MQRIIALFSISVACFGDLSTASGGHYCKFFNKTDEFGTSVFVRLFVFIKGQGWVYPKKSVLMVFTGLLYRGTSNNIP